MQTNFQRLVWLYPEAVLMLINQIYLQNTLYVTDIEKPEVNKSL